MKAATTQRAHLLPYLVKLVCCKIEQILKLCLSSYKFYKSNKEPLSYWRKDTTINITSLETCNYRRQQKCLRILLLQSQPTTCKFAHYIASCWKSIKTYELNKWITSKNELIELKKEDFLELKPSLSLLHNLCHCKYTYVSLTVHSLLCCSEI